MNIPSPCGIMLLIRKKAMTDFFGHFSLLKKQQNEKSCTNKHKSKSFVHLFKGGGVEGWSPSSLSADSEIPLFQKNGARGEKCESISRGGVQDRLPFLHTQANLPSKTFRWNVLDKATPPSVLFSLYKTDIFFDRLSRRRTLYILRRLSA